MDENPEFEMDNAVGLLPKLVYQSQGMESVRESTSRTSISSLKPDILLFSIVNFILLNKGAGKVPRNFKSILGIVKSLIGGISINLKGQRQAEEFDFNNNRVKTEAHSLVSKSLKRIKIYADEKGSSSSSCSSNTETEIGKEPRTGLKLSLTSKRIRESKSFIPKISHMLSLKVSNDRRIGSVPEVVLKESYSVYARQGRTGCIDKSMNPPPSSVDEKESVAVPHFFRRVRSSGESGRRGVVLCCTSTG
ncbi:hypothetical protein Tco_0940590 [Tanacetum coccineum]|uniref:Uncharacterized protein n=1 Tax=Tanacetum coccineum TaxID=301880 RepID=A0ABQ5DNE7_9ASTR